MTQHPADHLTIDLDAATSSLSAFQREWRGAEVGVIHGPKSEEDRIYLAQAPQSVSLGAVMSSLSSQGFKAVHIDPTAASFVEQVAHADLLFLNMHGEFGEDGRLQGLLDYLGKPYTGSGVLASALGLHKVMFKRVMRMAGVSTPVSASWGAHQPGELHTAAVEALVPPLMAKPVSGGSSLGMQLLSDHAEVQAFIDARDGGFFLEQFVAGRSLTVAVLRIGEQVVVSRPVEARFPGAYYDADLKMATAERAAHTYAHPDIDPGLETDIRAAALRVHHLIGCRGFSRIDFILTPSGTWYVLEINTIPGLTRAGNYVTCLRGLGLSYDQVVLAMLQSATIP
jgi:D-alanine-D-alanine ligase